jgi:hypothetical protein
VLGHLGTVFKLLNFTAGFLGDLSKKEEAFSWLHTLWPLKGQQRGFTQKKVNHRIKRSRLSLLLTSNVTVVTLMLFILALSEWYSEKKKR